MSKSQDTEIKLFGRTITSLYAVNHSDHPSSFSPVYDVSEQSKEAFSSSSSSSSPSLPPDRIAVDKSEQDNSRFKDPYKLSDLNEPPVAISELSSPRSSKNNCDQQSEITTSTSGDKILKKPDRILPCPRCESANTKFCYYNNYNVNQPRYFCRNCQRYWTAGGSMRKVPVGSGRRKNKGWGSSNNYLQVTSEDYDNSNNNNNSGTILSFGSAESSVTETVKDQSGDTKTDSTSQENKNYNGFFPQQVMLPNNSSPWPYQWSPTAPNANFYPNPFYWGCTVPLWPTSETSPCLGKRSRYEASVETEEGNKDTTTRARLVSGSLRINTEPATNKPVWSKLPTEPEKKTEGFSLFNGFETKGSNRRSLVPDTSLNLQANPAAMSRAMNFRESMQQ